MSNSVKMFQGLNPDRRTSSKVLRPPGGGSSDIFGLAEPPPQQKKGWPRNSKNKQVYINIPISIFLFPESKNGVSLKKNNLTEKPVSTLAFLNALPFIFFVVVAVAGASTYITELSVTTSNPNILVRPSTPSQLHHYPVKKWLLYLTFSVTSQEDQVPEKEAVAEAPVAAVEPAAAPEPVAPAAAAEPVASSNAETAAAAAAEIAPATVPAAEPSTEAAREAATASSTPPEPEKLAAQVETVTISDPVAPEASSAAPSEAAAPKEQPPSAAPVQEPIAQVRPARAAPPLALNPDEDIAPRPAVPAKTPGGGPNQAAAGAGNQDRVRIDPSSGQILGAPAARANRVPPGGFSSGGFW